jgi:uncharacterized protein
VSAGRQGPGVALARTGAGKLRPYTHRSAGPRSIIGVQGATRQEVQVAARQEVPDRELAATGADPRPPLHQLFSGLRFRSGIRLPSEPKLLFLICSLLFILSAGSLPALEVPFLSGRVVDNANLLPPEAEQQLDTRLAKLETETGAQVVVLTIPTLEDEPLEDFANRVAETWKLGRDGVDDGVLLLVAQQERGLRLEVGYGLEGKVPDILGKRILDERVVPRFRDGDFAGGISDGVAAVETAVRGGEALPPPAQPVPSPGGFVPVGLGIGFLLFLMPFASGALFTRGGPGWFLWLFLTPFVAAFPLAFFGRAGLAVPLLWLIGFPPLKLWVARQQKKGRFLARSTPGTRAGRPGGWGGFGGGMGGGWSSGGGGWSSGGGRSSGGGGFSGGGGSFGGGGASSSW